MAMTCVPSKSPERQKRDHYTFWWIHLRVWIPQILLKTLDGEAAPFSQLKKNYFSLPGICAMTSFERGASQNYAYSSQVSAPIIPY